MSCLIYVQGDINLSIWHRFINFLSSCAPGWAPSFKLPLGSDSCFQNAYQIWTSRTGQELASPREEGRWCFLFQDLLCKVSSVLLVLPQSCPRHCQAQDRGIRDQKAMARHPDLHFIYVNTNDADCLYFISLLGSSLCSKLGHLYRHFPDLQVGCCLLQVVASPSTFSGLLCESRWDRGRYMLLCYCYYYHHYACLMKAEV